jgi:hypothetical protein
MKQDNYHASITTGMPAAEAFKNINNVSAWWTKNVEGRSQKLNDVFTVRWGETFVTFRITEVVPDKKVVWLVSDSNIESINDKKEWTGTMMDWEVSQKNGSTQIDFTHIGLVPGIECYDMCEKGWTFFITESLAKLIDEGKGRPDRIS